MVDVRAAEARKSLTPHQHILFMGSFILVATVAITIIPTHTATATTGVSPTTYFSDARTGFAGTPPRHHLSDDPVHADAAPPALAGGSEYCLDVKGFGARGDGVHDDTVGAF